MKKLLLAVALFSASVAATPIEPSFKNQGLNHEQARVLAKVVKAYGYACKSITVASKSPWNGDFKLVCNNWNYVYKIKDVGGRVVVEVE